MITEKDLQEAIAECQGVRNPNANTCIKLASLLTIKDHMVTQEQNTGYSFSQPKIDTLTYNSGSEFTELASMSDYNYIIEVFDELMETLQVINPRLYAGVMRKLNNSH